jgi:hypothetical protein
MLSLGLSIVYVDVYLLVHWVSSHLRAVIFVTTVPPSLLPSFTNSLLQNVSKFRLHDLFLAK